MGPPEGGYSVFFRELNGVSDASLCEAVGGHGDGVALLDFLDVGSSTMRSSEFVYFSLPC